MRNMSFSLTTPQIRRREKTVTRRLGWHFLKRGEMVWAVEKGMGLKKGEKIVRLVIVIIKDIRSEPLQRMIDDPAYGQAEAILEGFPNMTGAQFVEMFCEHNKVSPDYGVNRIQFDYAEA